MQAVISKFVNDTKYGHIVNYEADNDELQQDMNRLVEWADWV